MLELICRPQTEIVSTKSICDQSFFIAIFECSTKISLSDVNFLVSISILNTGNRGSSYKKSEEQLLLPVSQL
jgi:hypothetical protein